jgi:hypothetical protein
MLTAQIGQKEREMYNNEEKFCNSCGSRLGMDCGEAEPDFNDEFCSKGCYEDAEAVTYQSTASDGPATHRTAVWIGTQKEAHKKEEPTSEESQSIKKEYTDDEIAAIRDELEEYYDEVRGAGMIYHPLITYLGYDPNSRESINMLGRSLEQKRERLKQAVAEQDWSLALMLHEKPSRLGALMEFASKMSDEEYWKELGDIWCQIENPSRYLVMLPSLFIPKTRGTSKRHLLMDDQERAAFDSLPAKLTIYRGCAESNSLGYSWSFEREQGEWFARRCGLNTRNKSGALLLIGECQKVDVIAHFTRRNEAEIMINPDDVKIVETIVFGGDCEISRVASVQMSDD